MGVILDLSKYQGNVDFAQLAKDKASGLIEGVILRVQAGYTYPDPLYKTYVAGCKQYGIPFGTYAYFKGVDVNDSIAEAESAFRLTDPASECFAVDIEQQTCHNTADLVPAGQAFVDYLKGKGMKNVGLYSGEWFYRDNGLASIKVDWTWIANYGANDGAEHTKPNIPGVDLWQFTSVGHIPGVATDVDESQPLPNSDCNFFTDHTIMVPIKTSSKPLMVVKVLVETDVRVEPSHTSGYIGNAHPGEIYNVWAHDGDFHLIIFGDPKNNVTGWVDGNGGKNLFWLDNPALVAAPKPAPQPVYYAVKSGDILSKIAAQFGVSIASIVSLNGLASPDKIYAGQKLRIK